MSYQHQIELWRSEAQALIEWGCKKVGMEHVIPHIHLTYRENMRTTRGRAFTNYNLGTKFQRNFVADVLNFQSQPGGMLAFCIPLYLRTTAEDRKENVLHELAHILANLKLGRSANHGRHWKAMMRALGETPKRQHSMDTTGLKRKQTRYRMYCPDRCGWTFTFAKARRTRRINAARKGQTRRCPKCQAQIRLEHWLATREIAD